MALTQITTERTYSYSHNVGMLTAFSGPVDMALGEPGQIFVSCRASEPGSRPGRGQGWVRWNLEDDTLILNVRSQASGEREIVWPSALVLDNLTEAASYKPTSGATEFPHTRRRANTWEAGEPPAQPPGSWTGPAACASTPMATYRNRRKSQQPHTAF